MQSISMLPLFTKNILQTMPKDLVLQLTALFIAFKSEIPQDTLDTLPDYAKEYRAITTRK